MPDDDGGKTPPAEELVRTAYARETDDTPILYEGMSLADIAHVVGLIDTKIIPKEAGGELVWFLLKMHPSRPLDFTADPHQGDLYTNREAYLKMLTPHVGWLSTGRARREATTIGYRIAVRSRLVLLSSALEKWIAVSLDRAAEHQRTLFPDYTYLHPAQPTVFGHYLLGFVYHGLRDLARVRAGFVNANMSPAGSGSVNGSRLPLDRGALAKHLGFEGLVPHARDAMWQADGPIELAALVSSTLVNVSRLAEDLQIFTTAEFDLIELDGWHTRSSVIMPQKRNPYSLAYLRGLAGESIGVLAAMAAVAKSPSGQIDNRMFAYGDVPRALDDATRALFLASGVMKGLTVKKDVASRRVTESFMGATDLADVILVERGIDYKTAHRIVGEAVRLAADSGSTTIDPDTLEQAAETVIGNKLEIPGETVASAMDPRSIVDARTGPGGASESAVSDMIAGCRAELSRHSEWRESVENALAEAETRLLEKARILAREPKRTTKEPKSWDDEFEGLPRMPPRRNWET